MHYYTKSWTFGRWEYLPEIGLYQCRETARVSLVDEKGMRLNYTVLPGFRTDGGSVPGAFQWLIKGWYEHGHYLTNLAFVVHDINYGLALVHRTLADDMLRGMLRDDGWGRFTAGAVCWAVNNFGARHYGTDDLDNAAFVRFSAA